MITDLLVGIADVDADHSGAERGQGWGQAIILPGDGRLLATSEGGRCHGGSDL